MTEVLKSIENLEGGDGDDSFSVILDGEVDNLFGHGGNDTFVLAGVSMGSVDGGSGSDTIEVESDVTLTGPSNEGILNNSDNTAFTGIETVITTNPQEVFGSDLSDTFTVTGQDEVSANEISFSNIIEITAGGGDDSVIFTMGWYPIRLGGWRSRPGCDNRRP